MWPFARALFFFSAGLFLLIVKDGELLGTFKTWFTGEFVFFFYREENANKRIKVLHADWLMMNELIKRQKIRAQLQLWE